MALHFETLLRAVVATPEESLTRLPMLPEPERARLLFEWNDTRVEYEGADRCLHTLFEEQAARTPDATAVAFEGRSLTYRELRARVNRLAVRLRALGVAADAPVGVCLERSEAMPVALLGVLKAGGAYVPLDPEYPSERLAFMLADSGAGLLLTQEGLRERSSAWGGKTVTLESLEQGPAPHEEAAAGDSARDAVSPDNLAYVIYTSGSTGQPKGVMISHRAIVNHMLWMQAEFPLGPDDRVFQKTVYGFDASVWELFSPLVAGARLVMARPDGHRDAAYMIGSAEAEGITVMQLVPSMLRVLLDEPRAGEWRGLRRMFCGGEALTYDLRRRFRERVGALLVNLYGPTETAIDATYWVCDPFEERREVIIGRPLGNVAVYILDGRMQPVPVGVTGELYVGGVQLARGYRGRAGLTAERFVPDPYSREPGARLYRTGDIARRLSDGLIEYMGRADHQVKLRGHRIELGEIEAALASHPSVRAAAVVVRGDAPGGERLVAYFVARGGERPSADELREHIAARLPRHMIPAAFVSLDALPLMTNGKVDRKALPAPSEAHRGGDDTYVAPRTPTEQVVAEIWAEVLRVERVGVNDNIYELGGHSLLAMQITSRVREAFDLEISLAELFTAAPTVAEMAAAVEERQIGEASSEDLEEVLRELRGLSDEEVARLLAGEGEG